MDKNFFDLVKDNFFRPLSGTTKRLNYELLQLINRNLEGGMEFVEKSEIINWIIEYCKWHPHINLWNDETDKQETDIKIFAANKLAYFERAGWFLTEKTNEFKIVYQLDPVAIEILRAMKNAETNETRPIEYSGYVYNIYTMLENFDIGHGTDSVEQIVEASKRLNDSLRGINNSIKRYINTLLGEESNNPNEILKTLLEDYHENVVSRAFENLRRKDNPSKYKISIIENLDKLLYEYMGRLTENYVNVKFGENCSIEQQHEATDYFINCLNSVKEQFENIENTINILNERNTKYVKAAMARLHYLMNEESDVEGKIYDILKSINSLDLSDEEEFEFSLKKCGRVDSSSLSNYTKRKDRPISKKIAQKREPNLKEAEKEVERLRRQTQFSILSINKFICEKLGDRQHIEAFEAGINNYDDLMRLYLSQIYAGSEHVDYYIELKEGLFQYNNTKLTNFTIYRRK